MRTTLDVDDDVLSAVKERARREKRSAGAVISDLARAALSGQDPAASGDFFGFTTIPDRGVLVTVDLVDQLAEEGAE